MSNEIVRREKTVRHDIPTVIMLGALALGTGLAGHAVSPNAPTIANIMYGLAIVSLAMCIEFAAGCPLLTRYVDASFSRRQRRIEAEKAASAASYEAAFQRGLERTRQYARDRAQSA